MEDVKKQKKVVSDQNQGNQNRLYTNFIYKAAIVMVFVVIIPLFPSEAPEFMNQTLFTRSWELLHLLFVGIAVSYGLFSRRNDDDDSEKETSNAQSYVSGLLHVPSVFDDEPEPEPESENGKVQTWSSQYFRNDPPTVVVPPGQSPREKPLLLPVRSLKSRVPDPDCIGSGSDQSSGSKRVSGGLRIREPELGENLNQNQNLVLPSPIPWRSRSGRLETSPNPSPRPNRASPMEESEPFVDQSRPAKPQIPRSSRPNSAASSPTATSAEFLRKNSFRWSPPPPPPPPPPATFPKSQFFKSDSATKTKTYVHDEERDLTRSYSNSSRSRTDLNPRIDVKGKSVRPTRAREDGEVEEEDSNFGGKKKSVQFDDDSSYGKKQYVDKVVVESESEEESEEEDRSGPDVDKKADEFIAKFREQIRLQRIESIKKSSGQINRNFQR